VYCNSASSWKASCGGFDAALIDLSDENGDGSGGGGPPTMGPSTLWEAWVEGENEKNENDNSEDDSEDASDDGATSDEDSSSDGDSTKEEEEEATTQFNFDPDGWTSNWDSREKTNDVEDEDLRWWVKQPSSSRMQVSSAASIVLLASIMAFCIY